MTQLNKQIDELANRAIRVLAIATTEDALGEDALPDSNNWTLVGVVGIRDEVRPESVTAIAEVKGAGVQVVMITGDRKETAVAIAKDAGLLEKDTDVVLTSDELAKLSDEEIKAEAARLLSELQKPQEPNSSNKTHYMAQISPDVLARGNSKDMDRLMAMLPFRSRPFPA